MVNKVKIEFGPNGIVFRGNGNGRQATTNLGEAAKQDVPVGKPKPKAKSKPESKPKPNSKPKPKSTPKPTQNTGNTSVGFLRKYFNPKTTGGKFRLLGLAIGIICAGAGITLMSGKKEAVPAVEYQLDREDSAKVRKLSPDREFKPEELEERVAQQVQIQAEKEKEPLIPPEDEAKIKELVQQEAQQPVDSKLEEKIKELVLQETQQPVDPKLEEKIKELVQQQGQQSSDSQLVQKIKQYIQNRDKNSEQSYGQKPVEEHSKTSETKLPEKSEAKPVEKFKPKAEGKEEVKPDEKSKTNTVAKPVQPTKTVEKAKDPETDKPFLDENGQYTVKEGDCIWNVVKAYLVTNGKPATVSNVYKEIDRLMAIKANDFLKWKSKGAVAKWFIDIYAGQKITFLEKKKAA